MAGGKSEYDPGIAAEICGVMATSSKGLSAICESDARFPHPATFYRWLIAHPELRETYARAKSEQLQILADEIQQIADEPQIGETITMKGDTREVKIADMIDHRRLRIDTRKWLLAKLAPLKYGDKVQTELSGSVQVKSARDMTLAELRDYLLRKKAERGE